MDTDLDGTLDALDELAGLVSYPLQNCLFRRSRAHQ
jgi:hypothetical protein